MLLKRPRTGIAPPATLLLTGCPVGLNWMLFRKTVGFVAWGFCEIRRQRKDQTLAPQTLHPPCPPVRQVLEGLGLSFLQDVLRPTLMPGLLELPTQSCPLGAPHLAWLELEQEGVIPQWTLSFLLLTADSRRLGRPRGLFSFSGRECRGYHRNQGPPNRSSIPARPA